METRRTRLLPWIIIAVLALFWFSAPIDVVHVVPAPNDTDAIYRFGDTRSVGQDFISHWGLKEIKIPIRNGDEVKGPLILHVRESYFGNDVRTAVEFPPHQSDMAVFTFRSITSTRPLKWVLEAPEDPDQTLGVFREKDESAYHQGSAYVKGEEIVGNFGFIEIFEQPQGIKAFHELQGYLSRDHEIIVPMYLKILALSFFVTILAILLRNSP